MTKKIDVPKPITRAFGWCGTWNDGRLGWFSPPYLYQENGKRRSPSAPSYYKTFYKQGDDRFYLVEVTMKPVLAKNGRPIVRRFGEAN